MKKTLCIAAALCAFSGAAFANEAKNVERATPQTMVLSDAQLDSAAGGGLVSNVLNGLLSGNLSGNSGLVNSNVAVPINILAGFVIMLALLGSMITVFLNYYSTAMAVFL